MSTPVLLLSKEDRWSKEAASVAATLFGPQLIWEKGKFGDAFPKSFSLPEYSVVLSFLSPWIVPAEVLNKSKLSLNFHPGSCDYPGIGCYNFALFEGAKEFGPVCHHMLPKVDSGTVVKETLFPIEADDRVETLKLRTLDTMLVMFQEIVNLVAQGKPLPKNARQWTRKAFTRRELDALGKLTPQMNEAEVERRRRAMEYPGYPGTYRIVNGQKQYDPIPPGPALA